MSEVACNNCWSIPADNACKTICNHILCDQCTLNNRSPRGLVCPYCNDLSTEDELLWFQVVNRQISDSEVKDLQASLVTIVCANGMAYLEKFLHQLYSLDSIQWKVKYQYMRKKTLEAQQSLKENEHGRKQEIEQANQSMQKFCTENEALRAQLSKLQERNEALNYTLKDRDRQLENWKQTYAKRTNMNTERNTFNNGEKPGLINGERGTYMNGNPENSAESYHRNGSSASFGTNFARSSIDRTSDSSTVWRKPLSISSRGDHVEHVTFPREMVPSSQSVNDNSSKPGTPLRNGYGIRSLPLSDNPKIHHANYYPQRPSTASSHTSTRSYSNKYQHSINPSPHSSHTASMREPFNRPLSRRSARVTMPSSSVFEIPSSPIHASSRKQVLAYN